MGNGLVAFNSTVDQLSKTARNLEAIQEAKKRREQENQLFEVSKKEADLKLQKMQLTGQADEQMLKMFKFQNDEKFKMYEDANKGKDAQISIAEQENQAKLKHYGQFARTIFENDPEVKAHVSGTVNGSMGGAIDGFERSLPQHMAIPQRPQQLQNSSTMPSPTGRIQQPQQGQPKSAFEMPVMPEVEYSGGDFSMKTPDTKEAVLKEIQRRKAVGEPLHPDDESFYRREVMGLKDGVETTNEKRSRIKDLNASITTLIENDSQRDKISEASKVIDNVPSGWLGAKKIDYYKNFDPENPKLADWQKIKSILTDQTLLYSMKTKGAISDKEMFEFRKAAANDDLMSAPRVKQAFEDYLRILDVEDKASVSSYKIAWGQDPRELIEEFEAGEAGEAEQAPQEQSEPVKSGKFNYLWE